MKNKKNIFWTYSLLVGVFFVSSISLFFIFRAITVFIQMQDVDPFDPDVTILYHIHIPLSEYENARKLYSDSTLNTRSDYYFSGATLSYRVGNIRGLCRDVFWRPGGQSSRHLPEIRINQKNEKYILPETYKLKFSHKCLGVKQMKLEFVTHESELQRQLMVRELYHVSGLITPRIGQGKVSVSISGIEQSEVWYTIEESFDDDFLNRVLPKKERGGWLFRVNTQGPSTNGSLTPLTPNQTEELIGIEDEAGRKKLVYDLKTNKEEFEAGKQKLLLFIDRLNHLSSPEKLRELININDLTTMTLINEFVGNSDDYVTQGNNYYLYFSRDDVPVRIFGVDFDSLNPGSGKRDFLLSQQQHILYQNLILSLSR